MEEENVIDAEKSQNVLATFREHLRLTFPNLSQSLPLNQIRNDTAGNISMVMPLPSKAEPSGDSTKGYINMGLPLDTPTFMLQFTPMAILTDDESSSPSSRSLINVSVATYHGVILKKDFLTFFINFNNPDNLDEAELRISNCELLTKLEQFADGFRLCAGFDVAKGLSIDQVFIEPYGETRDGHIIMRSRKCEFMLEMEEMFSVEKVELDRTTCINCGVLQNSAICIKKEPVERNNDFGMDVDSDSNDRDDPLEAFEEEVNVINDPNWRQSASRKSLSNMLDFYPCKHCTKKFKTERALQRHLRIELSNKFKCSKCGRKFKTEIIVQEHQAKCSGNSENKEDSTKARKLKPKRKRRTLEELKKSKENSEKKDPNKVTQTCGLCFREFSMQTRFEQHMELHKKRMEHLFDETPCPSEDCGLSFPDRLLLASHFEVHDKATAPCGYCLKILRKEKMRAHFFSEHPYQQYVCQICNKVCPFQSQLKQHTIEAHSAEKPKDVVCDVCGNRYRKEAGLRQHMASAHSAFREYHCFTCGKGFTTQAKLTQHTRIHTGVKPFKCVKCEYKANRSDNVLFHLRKVHKIDRPTTEKHVLTQDDVLNPLKIDEVVVDQSATPLATLIVNEIPA